MLRFPSLEHIRPYKDQMKAVKSKLMCELNPDEFEVVLIDFGRSVDM